MDLLDLKFDPGGRHESVHSSTPKATGYSSNTKARIGLSSSPGLPRDTCYQEEVATQNRITYKGSRDFNYLPKQDQMDMAHMGYSPYSFMTLISCPPLTITEITHIAHMSLNADSRRKKDVHLAIVWDTKPWWFSRPYYFKLRVAWF